MIDYEFYETPAAFTRWLFDVVTIEGTVLEPCVGDGAIVKAGPMMAPLSSPRVFAHRDWVTNDLDQRWSADHHLDASNPELHKRLDSVFGGVDWVVSNPPFTPAIDIITHSLRHARVGVAMHLRASIHEVLKTGVRRTWMAEHQPTGILWLPRFAYQRSKTTGKWTTDSVCACWVVWLKASCDGQFIRYAPERVIDELDAETPAYRERMDRLMAEVRKTA